MRDEIDQRKQEDLLDPALRAPQGVHRTLMSLLVTVMESAADRFWRTLARFALGPRPSRTI